LDPESAASLGPNDHFVNYFFGERHPPRRNAPSRDADRPLSRSPRVSLTFAAERRFGFPILVHDGELDPTAPAYLATRSGLG
jgi:hypothetical protein